VKGSKLFGKGYMRGRCFYKSPTNGSRKPETGMELARTNGRKRKSKEWRGGKGFEWEQLVSGPIFKAGAQRNSGVRREGSGGDS